MTTILALDTTTNRCTVALLHNDQEFIHSEDTPSRHAEVILSFINIVLNKAGISKQDIDVVAPTTGPGSFIGVRTSVSVGQTIAFALGCKVAPLPTLQVLAQSAYEDTGCHKVTTLLDARLEAIYFGRYELNDTGIMEAIEPEQLHKVGDIPSHDYSDSCLAGNALNSYANIETKNAIEVAADIYPQGPAMLHLAQALTNTGKLISPQDISPLYVRNDVAKKPQARK